MRKETESKASSLESARQRCMACGADSQRHVLTIDDTFSLVRCGECGLVATSPPVPPDEIGRYYPPSYYGENRGVSTALLEGADSIPPRPR